MVGIGSFEGGVVDPARWEGTDPPGIWPVHCVQGSWGATFHPDLRVVGETSDGLEIVPLVERLKPDVLINVALPYQYLPLMDACPHCQGRRLSPFGWGLERIFILRHGLPDIRMLPGRPAVMLSPSAPSRRGRA